MDSNALSNQTWCSSCKSFRDANSFETTTNGKKRKTCNRHGKKRGADAVGKKRGVDAVFHRWDEFEEQLTAWNYPV